MMPGSDKRIYDFPATGPSLVPTKKSSGPIPPMPAGLSGASRVGEELWWTAIAYTLGRRPTSQADLVHVFLEHSRLPIYGTLLSESLGLNVAMKVMEVRSSAVLTEVGNLRENT
jgi:hypothetical protein